jgi:hypothetical protein
MWRSSTTVTKNDEKYFSIKFAVDNQKIEVCI